MNKTHNTDARNLLQVLNGQKVDVTITSPPYYDLKDYGHQDQIGYGQDYVTYLEDLTSTSTIIISPIKVNLEVKDFFK